MVCCVDEHLDGEPPFRQVLRGDGELVYEIGGVVQGNDLEAVRKRDWLVKWSGPRHVVGQGYRVNHPAPTRFCQFGVAFLTPAWDRLGVVVRSFPLGLQPAVSLRSKVES